MATKKDKGKRSDPGYGVRSVYIDDPQWAEVADEVQTRKREDPEAKWTISGLVRDALKRELRRAARKRKRNATKEDE